MPDTSGICGWRTEFKAWDQELGGQQKAEIPWVLSKEVIQILCSLMSHHHHPSPGKPLRCRKLRNLPEATHPVCSSLGHLASVLCGDSLPTELPMGETSEEAMILALVSTACLSGKTSPASSYQYDSRQHTSLSGPQFSRVLSGGGRYYVHEKSQLIRSPANMSYYFSTSKLMF